MVNFVIFKMAGTVIFHPFAQKPPHGRICTKYGTALGAANVITCNKFLVIG